MKNLSKKLIVSVLALVLSVVALGTSTFAWFTLSNTASISPIDVEIEAGQGLELSVGRIASYAANNENQSSSFSGWTSLLLADDVYKYAQIEQNGAANAVNAVNVGVKYTLSDLTSINGYEIHDYTVGNSTIEGSIADSVNGKFLQFVVHARTQTADRKLVIKPSFGLEGGYILNSIKNIGNIDWQGHPSFLFKNAGDVAELSVNGDHYYINPANAVRFSTQALSTIPAVFNGSSGNANYAANVIADPDTGSGITSNGVVKVFEKAEEAGSQAAGKNKVLTGDYSTATALVAVDLLGAHSYYYSILGSYPVAATFAPLAIATTTASDNAATVQGGVANFDATKTSPYAAHALVIYDNAIWEQYAVQPLFGGQTTLYQWGGSAYWTKVADISTGTTAVQVANTVKSGGSGVDYDILEFASLPGTNGYYSADIVIRIWIEGWDPDCLNGMLSQANLNNFIRATFSFSLEEKNAH